MNVFLAILGGALVAGVAYLMLGPSVQPPPRLQDTYWGPGEEPEPKETNQAIRPFSVKFSKEMIEDLRHRLSNTRKMQPPLEDVGWTYGVGSDFVPTIVQHWLKFDFEKCEAYHNKYPQFITNIQGLDIYFLRVKPQLPKNRKVEVLPLLILHGWPGSVVEFYKIIPMLTTPREDHDFVFEIIAPSLPGFGYSQAAAKAGMGTVEMAHIMKNLMLRLGYDKFYAQGGDWGAVIAANMASMYPQHVIGLHSNMCLVMTPWTFLRRIMYGLMPWLLSQEDQQRMPPLGKLLSGALEETGYFHEQATKPDTIGIAVSDTPVGLAVYILEKFSSATKTENKYRSDGNLLEKFTMDELIHNLMMYWAPNKAISSFRIYAETCSKHSFRYKMEHVPVTVPTACAQFPHEIMYQPEALLRDRFHNLVRLTKMPRGGHFAAMEEPALLAGDIWAGIQTMRDLEKAKSKEKQNS